MTASSVYVASDEWDWHFAGVCLIYTFHGLSSFLKHETRLSLVLPQLCKELSPIEITDIVYAPP